MIKQLKVGTGRILHILEKHRVEERKQTVLYGEELLRAARSVNAFKSASGQYVVADEADDQFYCPACAPEKRELAKIGRAQTGTFRYDFKLGAEFPVNDKLPTQFRLMKFAVGTHLSLPDIRREYIQADLRQKEAKEAREKATAHKSVLCTVYHVIKESGVWSGVWSGSGESFSKWIVIQSKNGADMGNINHSKALMFTARDVFHDVIIRKLCQNITTFRIATAVPVGPSGPSVIIIKVFDTKCLVSLHPATDIHCSGETARTTALDTRHHMAHTPSWTTQQETYWRSRSCDHYVYLFKKKINMH